MQHWILWGSIVLLTLNSCETSTGGSTPSSTTPTSTSDTTTDTSDDDSDTASSETTSYPKRTSVPTWTTSTLITQGDAGQYCSLAVDSSNKVHIAYYFNNGSGNVGLGHMTNASGAFQSETVDTVGIAEGVSIAMDANDGIHIAYYATPSFDLKYAYKAKSATSWTTTTVDTEGTTGQYNAIAIDKTTVHIAYGDITAGALKYARNVIGETDDWEVEIIDGNATGQVHASIRVDSTNTVHVAYRSDTTTLSYVSGTAGSWSTPVTVDSGGAISDPSMVLNSAGQITISYYLGGKTNIKYATNASGTWQAQLITQSFSGTSGGHTSLVIDRHDDIFIAYYKETSSFTSLKIVVNIDGTWSDDNIDEEDEDNGVGQYASMALDKSGKLHIAYYKYNGGDLRYATEP